MFRYCTASVVGVTPTFELVGLSRLSSECTQEV